jgi:hypothetical protein
MGWVIDATPRPLYSRERPSTRYIEGCVGPRAGLDGCGKSRPPLGFDPQTVQPVARRYNYTWTSHLLRKRNMCNFNVRIHCDRK